MFAFILMLTLQGNSTETPVLTTTERRFELPKYIAPAIIPYMHCLTDRKGVAVRLSGRDGVPLPRLVEKGGDCSSFRERAIRDSDKLLRDRGGMSRKERRAYIATAIAEVEAEDAREPWE